LAAKNGVYNQINEGGLANESIFAVILQTFKELTNPNTYVNECSSVADWTRMSSPTSPYLFKEGSEENINIIKNLLKENPYAMFLRKVDRSFPDAVLTDIMSIDFGHVYLLLHNQYNVKRLEKAKEEKEGINSIVSYNKLANLFILITIILIFNYFFKNNNIIL
jgi:hypothetical protein